MGKTYIQLIKAAAARVRDSKLQKLGTKETGEALDGPGRPILTFAGESCHPTEIFLSEN